MTDEYSGQNDTESAGESQAADTASGDSTLLTGSESQPQDAPVEASSADADGNEEPAPEIPEKYEFNMPEGMEVDQSLADEALPVFKELGLSQEQADKLTGLMVAKAERDSQMMADAYQKQISDWATELKNDKDVGGEAFEKNVSVAREAINKFGSPELRNALNSTGMGNHPEVFKFALAVGKYLVEDQPGSGEPAKMESVIESRLYPNEARH